MLGREPLKADWKLWDKARLAFALEAHLIPPDQWEIRGVPQSLIQQFDDPCIGIGYHFRTGWFVLACGQGPYLVFVEVIEKAENRYAWPKVDG